MQYQNIREAHFLDRPNRFIANIELNGAREVAHVKNTGRCRELLLPGAVVYVQEFAPSRRKTRFDLVAVQRGDRLINMDSQVPNRVFGEWVQNGGFLPGVTLVRPEARYGNSRLDFYLEAGDRRLFAEIKGVTLEEDGAVFFPDAPTLRGLRHLEELSRAADEGYEAWAVFIIQMKGVRYFAPNDRTQPDFGAGLLEARRHGVRLLALDCLVTPDSIAAGEEVEIRLEAGTRRPQAAE